MISEWNSETLAEGYSHSSDDSTKNWYENEVNIPSILSLLPSEEVRLLDFGCGPGNFTKMLSQHHDVSGADTSSAMVKVAQHKFSGIPFFVWDGLSNLPVSYNHTKR